MMHESYGIDSIFFVLGAVAGSFLNVCIVRLPLEKSVVWPGSHCVHCQKPIAWYDNIPLLSFLLLKAKCRLCQKRISARYFGVELLTALTFVAFARYFGVQWILLPYLVFVCGLIVATFVDFEYRIIPDEVSLGGAVAGLILSALIPQLHQTDIFWMGFLRSLWGLLIGGGVIYLMGMLGDWMFKKESMGGGDIKLMAMVGAFLGWKLAVLTFFVAPFFGAVVGIIEKIRTNDNTIAYGPFLALGALISLFLGDTILAWLMNQYGFPY